MDAWVDCMTSLHEFNDGLSTAHDSPGGAVALRLDNVGDFAARCFDLYAALVKCAAFVNWRRLEIGHSSVLALAFFK